MKRARYDEDGELGSAQDQVLNPYGGRHTLTDGTHVEITAGTLFDALSEHVVKNGSPAPASLLAVKMKDYAFDEDDEIINDEKEPDVSMLLGCGELTLDFEGRKFHLTRQAFGQPSRQTGMRPMSLVLSHPERSTEVTESMKRLCRKALAEHESNKPGQITLYSFTAYWHKERVLVKRSLTSVILPADKMNQVVADVKRFLAPETQAWYMKHCIPYKRAFLLHGPPGCGKSSLVRAVASHFDCGVCMASLADKDLEDKDLRIAMSSLPKRSVVAFEDVDALFDHHREQSQGTRHVTFSGFLNALDGVSDPHGTIIFLTTNHKSRLDPALIRPGRCDVQVEITHATDEQIARCFERFYPEASEKDCEGFVAAVRVAKGGKRLSMSQLQEHFVQHRESTMAEASADIKLGEASSAEEARNGSFYG